jgi:ADP-heptose:LPS heptosyltransferase
LESTSPAKLAAALFDDCLQGRPLDAARVDALADWALDADEALALLGSRALFAALVEPLADRFEPALCTAYARLFARVLERAGLGLADLEQRYAQVRRVRAPEREPEEVVVLSRVTLGADINVTSVLMDAARRRYPRARWTFAGPRKAWELFAGSAWNYVEIPYGRTALLRDRLACFAPLRELLSRPAVLLLDPDSRLTQLGLLPVCDAPAHHLFEGRAYGGDSALPLPELARRWCAETLGVDDAEPWFHPARTLPPPGARVATVSFGIGENPAKRVEDPFEETILRTLIDAGYQVLLDTGAPGGAEEARVRAAVARLGEAGERIALHTGSFANFAAFIAQSQLYVGYDSAGQHAAAAVDVPLISVFRGYCTRRMFERWSPASRGPARVIDAEGRTAAEMIRLTGEAIAELARAAGVRN